MGSEIMNSENAPVTALNAGEDVLSHFWDLASLDQSIRRKAAESLINVVLQSQREAVSIAPSTGNGQAAHALRQCSPLSAYIVERLFKGLSSNRQGARQGFTLTLTGILHSQSCIDVHDALKLLKITTDTAGLKGAEARDALFGRLFGLAAIIRAVPDLPAEDAAKIMMELVDLAEKRSFLREAATSAILELAEKIDDAALQAAISQEGGLHTWLVKSPEEAFPEALLLSIQLWGRLPQDVATTSRLLPQGQQLKEKAAAFFSQSHLQQLLPVFRASTRSHPQLHSLWGALLSFLVPAASSKKDGISSGQLQAFWSTIADGDLLQGASPERRFLGLSLFNRLLPHLSAQDIPIIFTPNLLRTLSGNLSKSNALLHGLAKRCMDGVANFVTAAQDPAIQVAVQLALQRHEGLDRILKDKKSKENRNNGMEAGKLDDYVEELKVAFKAASKEEANAPKPAAGEEQNSVEAAESEGTRRQKWAIEQLCGVLKQSGASESTKAGILKFLAVQAFFEVSPAAAKSSKDSSVKAAAGCTVSAQIRQLCASRLITISDALSKPPSASKQLAAAKDTQHGQHHNYLIELADYADGLLSPSAKGVAVAHEMADEATRLALLLSSLRRSISVKTSDDANTSSRIKALWHLLSLLELHCLADPEALDASVTEDLGEILSEVFEGGKKASKGRSSKDEDVEKAHWMDILIDVLLSLLLRTLAPMPSAPVRDAIEAVFRTFCSDLTATGMGDLLRVLEEASGDDDGNDDEDLSGSDSDDGGSESESPADSMEEDVEASGSDNDDASDDDNDDDEEGGDNEVPAGGSDSDADVDDGATDEQMFRMDQHLAAHMSLVKEEKGKAKAKQQELQNFKMRVAALIETFVKRQPGSPLLLTAVVPLLNSLAAACRTGGDNALAERISGLVSNRIARGKAEAAGPGIANKELEGYLRRTLHLALRSSDKRVQATAVAGYQFLQRAAVASHQELAVTSATAAVSDFFTKKRTRLSHSFFVGLFRRLPVLGCALLPELLQQAGLARNDFLKLEAWALAGAVARIHCKEMEASLRGAGAAFLAASLAALQAPFPKAQRQAEVVKSMIYLAEAFKRSCGVAAVLSSQDVASLDAGLGTALEGSAGSKLMGQYKRLQQLVHAEGAKPKSKQKPSPVASSPAKKRLRGPIA